MIRHWIQCPLPILLLVVLLPRCTPGQVHDEMPVGLSGFTVSETYDIKDDQPLDLDAYVIQRLLYRLKNTSPRTRSEFSQFSQDVKWNEIVNQTDAYRMWMFDRWARVKKIEVHRLANATEDSEINQFFVCHCEAAPNDGQTTPVPFLVIARSVPELLPLNVAMDEPIRVFAFLYRRIVDAQDNHLPVLIADRIGWFPDQSRPDGATQSQVSLAAYGVDIGQFDVVRANNSKRLSSRDSETFYQMISATDRMPPLKQSIPRRAFNDVITKGESMFGESIAVSGFVRTCSPITIDDIDIQDRMGVSKYYQLMVFPNIGIVIEHPDGTKTEYERFPITVVCTHLPSGMSADDMKRKRVQIDGFFFRYWSFRSDKSDQAFGNGQPSPLIIANAPILLEPQTLPLNSILIGLLLTVLAGITVFIVGVRFMDRKSKKQARFLVEQLPDKIDISGFDDQV